MPEQRQTILRTVTPPNKSKGARRDQNIRAAFASSPIYNGDLSDEERKKAFEELVMTGIVLNGKGVNSFDRDFNGNPQNPVPNLSEVETGGVGYQHRLTFLILLLQDPEALVLLISRFTLENYQTLN